MPDFYKFARKILFRLDAETAHHLTLSGMVWANRLGLLGVLTGSGRRSHPVGSEIEVMGLSFPNRVGLAAGLDKAGIAVDAFGSLGFGHVEVGTVTPRPQPGNDQPRLFRLVEHEAIINRMGFNNPGVLALLDNLKKSRRRFRGILGINIGKNFDTPNEEALEDYLAGYQAVYGAADYVAVNLSSPNTKGLRDLQNVETCRTLILTLQAARDELAKRHGGKRTAIA
ncbi:MAG: dihydroorotate dehydrogenase (quinone), partial [Verrucomicrobiae bacterium]|nr:dihydroorotate dehydrogenase (quinone) [Verrucomicrobiae bacterium]